MISEFELIPTSFDPPKDSKVSIEQQSNDIFPMENPEKKDNTNTLKY